MKPKLYEARQGSFDNPQKLKYKMLKPAPDPAQCFLAHSQVGSNIT
jgi:hypothetical protein